MKKISLTLCVLCMALVMLTSCGGMNDVKNAGEDVKNSVTNTAENIGTMTSNADANVDRTSFITEEMAKQNAVEKAGVNAADVIFSKVEFERDDKRYVYEIEFTAGNTEYEAEVSAADGSILSWDVDKRD